MAFEAITGNLLGITLASDDQMLQLFAIFLRTVPFSAILSNSSRPFSLRAFYHYGSGSLYFSLVIAAISDHLPKFAITSNSYGTKLTRSSIYLKKIGPNLIKKNLHLIIFLLTGIKYWKMIMKKLIIQHKVF